ncbi:hypothetical protein ABID52_002829 [Fictibacillus halophilus]|uniref:Uncharacterized protein n=1 Tax=Fictibacillus halophilus TaxID=1610490 RepID=A0ABV2LL03_9BACL|nr:hypothetical protein [Fictibacillus halophilus]
MKMSPSEIEQILLKAKREQLNAYYASVIQHNLSKWSIQDTLRNKG